MINKNSQTRITFVSSNRPRVTDNGNRLTPPLLLQNRITIVIITHHHHRRRWYHPPFIRTLSVKLRTEKKGNSRLTPIFPHIPSQHGSIIYCRARRYLTGRYLAKICHSSVVKTIYNCIKLHSGCLSWRPYLIT